MIQYWPWGLVITSTVTVTIWMNGRHWRSGWLVGAAAQLAQVGFGVVTGIWTFLFAVAPMLMFLWNWLWQPARDAARRAEHEQRLANLRDEIVRVQTELARSRRREAIVMDVANGDQMIMMSRGVLDRIKETAVTVPRPGVGLPVTLRDALGMPWLRSPISPVNLSPLSAFGPEQISSVSKALGDAYAELAGNIRQAEPLITPEQVGKLAAEIDVRSPAEQLGVDVPQDGDERG